MRGLGLAICLLVSNNVIAQSEKSLQGRVLDSGGKPVASAKVWMVLPGGITEKYDTKPLADTTTNADGHFELKLPTEWRETKYNEQGHPGVVVFHPDHSLAALAFHRSTTLPADPVTIQLKPREETSLLFWSHELKPVKDLQARVSSVVADVLAHVPPTASIELQATFDKSPKDQAFAHARWHSKHFLALPAELRERFTSTSDADGKATWKGFSQQQLHFLLVTQKNAPDMTVTKSPYKMDASLPAGVVLPASCTIEGHLKAPKPEMLKDLVLPFYSMSTRNKIITKENDKFTAQPDNFSIFLQSQAGIAVQADGSFKGTLTEGNAGIHGVTSRDGHLLVGKGRFISVVLSPTKTSQLDLEFKPTVLVKGVVQDLAGKPLAGISLRTNLQSIEASDQSITDAAGHFQFQALPGECQFYGITGQALPYLSPRDLISYKSSIPANVTEFTLPVMKLPTWTEAHGQLLDEQQKPCQGTVTARWLAPGGRTLELRFQTVTSDEQGRFTLKKLDPRLAITLKAVSSDLSTEQPVAIPSNKIQQPMMLTLKKGARQAGEGLILSQGKPVAGAVVTLWWKPPASALKYVIPPRLNAPAVGQPIPLEDVPPTTGTLPVMRIELPATVTTDDRGAFRLPAILEGDGEYQVEASKPGWTSARSRWLHVTNESATFAPIEMAPRRLLAGQIVDPQGQPIPQASLIYHDVISKQRFTCDAQGAFKTEHNIDNSGYLIASAPGYRTAGVQLKNSSLPVRLTMTPLSQAPTQAMPTLAPVLSLAERRKLFETLFASVIAKAGTEQDDNNRFGPVNRLAQQNPTRALELINKKPFKTGWMQDSIKATIALKLARETLEEARTIAESITSANGRARVYLEFANQQPADKLTLKKELLAQSMLHARAEVDASHRLLYLAKIGTQLLELKQTEDGTRLLREAQAAAEQLPTSGWGAYARGSFAEDLSGIDPAAAEKLCDAIQDASEKTRHLGNLAHLLAGKQPDLAERLLTKAASAESNEFEYGRYAMRVCYRMADVDLPKAISIAERMKVQHHMKAEAFASMARALVDKQPKEAKQLLRRAYAVLAEQARDSESDFTNIVDSATVAASFLPVAESLDPKLVPEFLWQTMAMRPDPAKAASVPFAQNKPAQGDCTLALFLARYHHELAKELLEQHAALMLQSTDANASNFFAAAAIACPGQITPWLKQIPMTARSSYYLDAALDILLQDGDALWKEVHRRLFMWYPDKVDN